MKVEGLRCVWWLVVVVGVVSCNVPQCSKVSGCKYLKRLKCSNVPKWSKLNGSEK